MCYGGNEEKLTIDEVIFKNDNLASEYLKSQSKIVSLAKPLSNIEGALQTTNVLTQEHGAYGILSNASKDGDGAIPLSPDERKRIEDQVGKKNYGNKHGQSRTIITNASMNFTPMSFPMKDMMLIEQNEENFSIILGAYGLDRDIFPSVKGATNENKEKGLLATIQNTIQSEADDLMQTYNEAFNLEAQGLALSMSYDHLPVIQAYKTSRRSNATDGIIKVNLEVNAGRLDRETAVNILVSQYGYDVMQAEAMITKMVTVAGVGGDTLGKLPLALQQLALARERALAIGDKDLVKQLGDKMDELLKQI
jgi:hypothetical protein